MLVQSKKVTGRVLVGCTQRMNTREVSMYWIVVRTPSAAISSGVMKKLSQGASRARLRRAAG
eukprot:5697797-Heterocapsa_arctica.AAC.1